MTCHEPDVAQDFVAAIDEAMKEFAVHRRVNRKRRPAWALHPHTIPFSFSEKDIP
jgi:hypothetical protein